MFEMPYDQIGAGRPVRDMTHPWKLATTTKINAQYSLSSEVTLRTLSALIDTVLMEKAIANDPLYGVSPLHGFRKALDKLMSGPFDFLFEQNRNTESAMETQEIHELIAALPRDTKNIYGHRSCIKTDLICAGMHAAVMDMLSYTDTTLEPILMVASHEYIRKDEISGLDDIYYKIARYVGIVHGTSYLARKLHLNSLNEIRKNQNREYTELVRSICDTLASRMADKDSIEVVEKFFSDNHPYIYHPLLADAIDICDNYYRDSNVKTFEMAKQAYKPVL